MAPRTRFVETEDRRGAGAGMRSARGPDMMTTTVGGNVQAGS